MAFRLPLSALCMAVTLVPGPLVACDLALALAVDVSGSVDTEEFRIQMDGLATGLRDSVVSEALVRSKARLKLVQWTGSSRQQSSIPWTEMGSFEAVEAFAARVEQDQRIWRNFSTAIGEALEYTMSDFAAVADCTRLLIDVSGDGPSNEGIGPEDIKPMLRDARITVNAIAIEESEPDLTAYFYENVIVGNGAFVVTASGFADYPDKIRKKLLREVTRQTAWEDRNVITPAPPVITKTTISDKPRQKTAPYSDRAP